MLDRILGQQRRDIQTRANANKSRRRNFVLDAIEPPMQGMGAAEWTPNQIVCEANPSTQGRLCPLTLGGIGVLAPAAFLPLSRSEAYEDCFRRDLVMKPKHVGPKKVDVNEPHSGILRTIAGGFCVATGRDQALPFPEFGELD